MPLVNMGNRGLKFLLILANFTTSTIEIFFCVKVLPIIYRGKIPAGEQDGEEQNDETDWAEESKKQIGSVKKMAEKVMTYIEDSTANIDKETLGKYAAVGILLLAGTRKSGFLGSLACSIAAGVITKY